MIFAIGNSEIVDISEYIDYKMIKEFIFYMNRGSKYILFGDRVGNMRLFIIL